jgi:hypothetical protein
VCKFFRDEGYKAFYRNNVFVFQSVGGDKLLHNGVLDHNMMYLCWEDVRDPCATRMLDFIDRPEWRNRGSMFFRGGPEYNHGDLYRHLIRNLVINANLEWSWDIRLDWDWPLKVDWKTLPHLEFLQLDLRTYFRQHRLIHLWRTESDYNDALREGAKRMQCLNLKKLVLFGLCSFDRYSQKAAQKQQFEISFRPAMRPGGKIEFLDQEFWVSW